jgi:hypothetical protein
LFEMDSEGYIDVMIASWQSLWQAFFATTFLIVYRLFLVL